MQMLNSFPKLYVFAPFVCNTHNCHNHRQAIDIASFTVEDERGIYDCPEDSLDFVQCHACGIHHFLADPYRFLGSAIRVEQTSLYMLFNFDADDIDNIRIIYKNAVEDSKLNERVFLASDEAFKFDHKFEVWDVEIFRADSRGNLQLPKRSPLPNRNKVLIVNGKGVRFQSDAEVLGRQLVVSSPLFTMDDMDAWHERLRYTAPASVVDVADDDEEVESPF
jgi:hypothetical protein